MFVANRVQLIRAKTDPNDWHYIDTTQNPADLASRGLRAADIVSSGWLSGPKFLWEQELLPVLKPSPELLVGDPEVKSVHVFATQVSTQMDVLRRLERFSTWTTLLKVVARIKRLGARLKHDNVVTAAEHKRAADEVLKLVQQQAFPEELRALQKNPPRSKSIKVKSSF